MAFNNWRNEDSFPPGIDDIDSFTCQVLGETLGRSLKALDFLMIFGSPLRYDTRVPGKLTAKGTHKNHSVGQGKSSSQPSVFGFHVDFPGCNGRHNFCQWIWLFSPWSFNCTFLRSHCRWSHCHVFLLQICGFCWKTVVGMAPDWWCDRCNIWQWNPAERMKSSTKRESLFR